MTAPISFGFLRPSPEVVEAGPWTVTGSGIEAASDPEVVPDWDHFTDLRVARSLEIDLPGLLRECDLDERSTLYGIITWQCSWTKLRGGGPPSPLRDGVNTLELDLDGRLLGGRLTLEARIVLGDAVAGGPLSPELPGSLLWSEPHRVTLEGIGARFPTVPISFAESGIAGGHNGAWALTVDSSDLAASGSGHIRLYLNSDHPAIRALIDQPDAPQSVTLQQMIRYDLARQLFTVALHHEDFDDQQTYEDDTLGQVLGDLTGDLFPGRTLQELRGNHRISPGELEAEIQARVGLLSR